MMHRSQQCCLVSKRSMRERREKNMNFKLLVWIKRGDGTFIDVRFQAMVFMVRV